MFVVVNRFKVRLDWHPGFRRRWLDRAGLLNTAPGCLMIPFLKGSAYPNPVAYISHTFWASREAFEAWRGGSDLFQTAHKNAGKGEHLTIGQRAFSASEVLRTVEGMEQAA
ncbi:antibiotic biosynthesis monooxygenase [Gluconobacter sp. R75690]|uniref:antibiotic biosynthesis monooxygenase family protein n=1 Tax=Gluconobacter sp. R75828 TaxID=2724932 RepID=UPI00188C5E2D|nr:antibiotic biosynthesis monooxygenase [Gluconobacter sp. R75828]MBF0852283.1 antibiotic biosynthesis monooxygenase [Gluconobacter sp. R75690]MBF0880974.1 antibiotic biosynthesis monooxygenase [Gluconobacter sp. R75828]